MTQLERLKKPKDACTSSARRKLRNSIHSSEVEKTQTRNKEAKWETNGELINGKQAEMEISYLEELFVKKWNKKDFE